MIVDYTRLDGLKRHLDLYNPKGAEIEIDFEDGDEDGEHLEVAITFEDGLARNNEEEVLTTIRQYVKSKYPKHYVGVERRCDLRYSIVARIRIWAKDRLGAVIVQKLRTGAINYVPRDHDYGQDSYGEENGYEFEGYARCEECGAIIQTCSEITHSDHDADSYCNGVAIPNEPLMNYFYPLPRDISEEAKKSLVDTCLCVVKVGGDTGFALSGGGMDLSWEICEAYILAGFLPPIHFCPLPMMADKGSNPGDFKIIQAMQASWKHLQEMSKYTLKDLKDTEKKMKEYQKKCVSQQKQK